MTRRLEMHYRYPASPERIRAVLTDERFLRDRLREIGGPGAELVSRTENGSGRVTLVQRQGLPADALPSAVRSFVPDDLTIERTEDWTGPTDGTIDVVLSGAPGSVTGTLAVVPDADGPDANGSVLTITVDASVPVPLFGGTIERVVTDNIEKLGDVEYAFTCEWLRRHPG